ncbi:MAG: response regulator [Steroidobacteraceae bacterium]
MRNMKILIVDDDPDVRQAMHIRLKANGYETCFASDALTTVSEARRHQPDLVLLDLGLPGGDGYTVMERLRRHPALAVIPVIVVSARDAGGNQSRVMAAGAKAYLQKPVNNSELLSVIRETLGEPAQPGDAGVTANWKLLV